MHRDDIISTYELELKEARRWAHIIGFLHIVSRFLAACNLTWATVALLGAFLPDLVPHDFAFITCLLFIEVGRLASASSFLHDSSSSFLRFLKRPLSYGSQDPEDLFHSEDGEYPVSRRIRLSSNFVQFVLSASGIVVPIIGHVLLDHYSEIRNLRSSLRIFYSFVALNSLVALVNLICSVRAFDTLYKPPEQSVLRYFDTVLENALSRGLVRADAFDFFSFAYTMLAGEYRRNVQPRAVEKVHNKLIRYLYAHRVGVDALQIYLEVEDPFMQIAAVCMVGFWSDRTWGIGAPGRVRKLPEELLTKLADKVGVQGQLGWQATTSFAALAGTPKGAGMVAATRTSSGNVGLLDRLVNVLDESSVRSFSLVRLLVEFYEQWCTLGEAAEPPSPSPSPFENESSLLRKLETLARESRLHRLRVNAAFLLLLLERRCIRRVVLAIDPAQDAYWFTNEVDRLELLRSHIPDAPPLQCPLDRLNIRPSGPITVPSWAKPLAGVVIVE